MVRRYPGIFLLAAVILGIVAADELSVAVWISFPLAVLTISLGLVSYGRSRTLSAGILLAIGFAAISATHFGLRYVERGPNDLSRHINSRQLVRVYGTVADWPNLKYNKTRVTVDVDSLVTDRSAVVKGAILLQISDTTTSLQRGDRLDFLARIYPVDRAAAPGEFDYSRYLRLHGIRGTINLPTVLGVRVTRAGENSFSRFIDFLRREITCCLKDNLSPLSASLAAGFLIGETHDIPPEIYRLFRDSGTLHLLAVSGSNVALVVLFVLVLMRPFGPPQGTKALVLLAVIIVFSGLSYGEPSVIRAAIMAGLVIIARYLGRLTDLNHIIAMTALIILLIDPAQLYDVGFQLSFVTAWGLILFVPVAIRPLEQHQRKRWYRWLVFPLIVSLIAQIVSTPIVVHHFHRIPLISVVANLVIVPAVSIAVVAVMVLLLAALILPIFGMFVGSLVDWWLRLLVDLLLAMGGESLPVIHTESWLPTDFAAPLVIIAYVVIGLGIFSIASRRARRVLLLIAAPLAIAALSVGMIGASGQARMTLELESVPGGVSALVTSPGRESGDLVITGLREGDYQIEERVLLPKLRRSGVTSLSKVFLLSSDFGVLDDVLRLTDSVRVDSLLIPPGLEASLRDVVSQKGDPLRTEIVLLHPSDKVESFGWVAVKGGVELRLPESRVVFLPRVLVEQIKIPANDHAIDPVKTLVIGETWTPAATDWVSLREAGCTHIICSKIAQAFSEADSDPSIDPDQIPPDYCVDLSQVGRYVLELPAKRPTSGL